MPKIKIIGIPPGEAPEWVRKEWVGLELPIDENVPPVGSSTIDQDGDLAVVVLKGVSSGKTIPAHPTYTVSTVEAINILRQKSPEAAKWWEDNLGFNQYSQLDFHRDSCELIQ